MNTFEKIGLSSIILLVLFLSALHYLYRSNTPGTAPSQSSEQNIETTTTVQTQTENAAVQSSSSISATSTVPRAWYNDEREGLEKSDD